MAAYHAEAAGFGSSYWAAPSYGSPSPGQSASYAYAMAQGAAQQVEVRNHAFSTWPYAPYALQPDGYLHALALQGYPGSGYHTIMPEGWEGWIPGGPGGAAVAEQQAPVQEQKPKKKKEEKSAPVRSANSTRISNRISEELTKRLQSQLQSATRGVSLKKLFSKYDGDRSGTLSSVELKKLIRKELRITPALLSDSDIDNLTLALDDDGEGTISIDEFLDFIERGSATFFSTAPGREDDEDGEPEGNKAEADRDREQEPAGEEGDSQEDSEKNAGRKAKKRTAVESTSSTRPSKTVLAAMTDPNSRMMFLPFGGSLISHAAPTPRKNMRPRKEALLKLQNKSNEEPASKADTKGDKKDKKEKKDQKEQKEQKAKKGGKVTAESVESTAAKGCAPALSDGNYYWLRGSGGHSPTPLGSLASPRAVLTARPGSTPNQTRSPSRQRQLQSPWARRAPGPSVAGTAAPHPVLGLPDVREAVGGKFRSPADFPGQALP